MLRHPLNFLHGQNLSVEGLKNAKKKLEYVSPLHPVKLSILDAIIDYQIALENRNGVAYTFTNMNERNQDIKFILDHLKLNDYDFILILKGYIASKPDTSEFKQLINKNIEKSELALKRDKNIREVFGSFFSAMPLITVALMKDDDINKKLALMAVFAMCTFGVYFMNKKVPGVTVFYDTEEKNARTSSRMQR